MVIHTLFSRQVRGEWSSGINIQTCKIVIHIFLELSEFNFWILSLIFGCVIYPHFLKSFHKLIYGCVKYTGFKSFRKLSVKWISAICIKWYTTFYFPDKWGEGVFRCKRVF